MLTLELLASSFLAGRKRLTLSENFYPLMENSTESYMADAH
jgi:hypothetical protein